MVTRRIVSTAVMLTACAASPARAQEAGFIEVTGTGAVAIEANRAHVSFAVETRFPGAAAAASANADAMESVLGTLRSAGLEGLSLATPPLLAGGCAGCAYQLTSHPVDVIRIALLRFPQKSVREVVSSLGWRVLVSPAITDSAETVFCAECHWFVRL